MGERQKIEEEWQEMEEINNSLNVNQADQLESSRYKMKAKIITYQKRKGGILENEIPGMRKEIPKEETKNKYGDASRRIEIAAIEKHGTCIRVPFQISRKGVTDRRTFCVYYQKQTNN